MLYLPVPNVEWKLVCIKACELLAGAYAPGMFNQAGEVAGEGTDKM